MKIGAILCINQTITLVLLIQSSLGDCTLAQNSLSRRATVDSWTGNWTFEGYTIGPNSSDNYYLLSSADDNQCGLIREDASGQKVWAKTYSNGQCSGIAMTNDETLLYFSSAYTGYYAIGEVNCTDGSLNNYIGFSGVTLDGKINSIYFPDPSDNRGIYAVGNISFSGSSVSYIQYDAVNRELFYENVPDTATLTKLLDYKSLISNVLGVYVNSLSNYEITFEGSCGVAWSYNISCSSTCPSSDYAKSDYDQTNVHVAINIPSEGKALLMVFAQSNGDLVGNLKTTSNSQQLTLGSLYADTNAITWVSMYSGSSSYSELIKYDSSNNNYTIYQQTGYSYSLQYIDLNSNNDWLALGVTSIISNATQTCLTKVGGLSVSTTTSGLEDTSLFTLDTIGSIDYLFDSVFLNINTSITSAASDMAYSFTIVLFVETNEDDDDLSTAQIIGIALGSVFGLAIIFALVFAIFYILYKRRSRYAGHQEVKATDVPVENHDEQEVDNQHPEDDIPVNQI